MTPRGNQSLLSLCLSSPPVFIRCSCFISYFLFGPLTQFRDGLLFTQAQAYPLTCGWGLARVQADLQYEIRTLITRVGTDWSRWRNREPGHGCPPLSSPSGPGQPRASIWTHPEPTWSLQHVNGKKVTKEGGLFTIRRDFESQQSNTTGGPALDSD